MYFLYSIVSAAVMVVLTPYFLVQGMRQGKYLENLWYRFGKIPPVVAERASAAAGAVWIHAVSVGEVMAALPLAQRLREILPGFAVFVSTTTITGQRVAQERMLQVDGVFYFPLDWSWAVRRALRSIRPSGVVVMETEIWPNFLREARRRGTPVIFANARISRRSFIRYRRIDRILGDFLSRVLADATLFLSQSPADASRLLELGAAPERVVVTGNMKYDLAIPASGPFAAWLAEQKREQERWPIAVAGSVAADEEEEVLSAFDVLQRRWRRALLVLAPRKPERFGAAAEIALERGWKVIRRSPLDGQSPLAEDADVIVLDSIGELAGIYRCADVVFIGGSLTRSGGHNILEPACFGKVPIFGPHMENFQQIAAAFLAAGAALEVSSGLQLGAAWVQLIEDGARRERMGLGARRLLEENRGATERVLQHITQVLAERGRQ